MAAPTWRQSCSRSMNALPARARRALRAGSSRRVTTACANSAGVEATTISEPGCARHPPRPSRSPRRACRRPWPRAPCSGCRPRIEWAPRPPQPCAGTGARRRPCRSRRTRASGIAVPASTGRCDDRPSFRTSRDGSLPTIHRRAVGSADQTRGMTSLDQPPYRRDVGVVAHLAGNHERQRLTQPRLPARSTRDRRRSARRRLGSVAGRRCLA